MNDPSALLPQIDSGPGPDAGELTDTARAARFQTMWEVCRVSVRAYLSSMVANRSDIEDCVQEVALIAWKKGPISGGERAFLGHCLATARLIGLTASRKSGNSRICFLPPDLAASLANEVMRQEQQEERSSERILALRACMERLDAPQRHLLSLRYEGDGPFRLDHFARSEGMKPDALYKKLERLRAGLGDCVKRRMKGAGDHA